MLIFAGFIYWLDHYEKEPKILLGIVFLWGAVIAAGTAFVFNTIIGVSIFLLTGSENATELATGSLAAPIIEEILKAMAVMLIYLLFKTEFDSILDGIIYASITALGFAATENFYYIYQNGYLVEGWNGLYEMAFIRIILVGWQHPFFTSFFGIGLAIARLNQNKLLKITAPVIGLCTAVFTHSLHNTLSPFLIESFGGTGFIIGSFLDWSGWFIMLIFIIWVIFRERDLLVTYLLDEVAQENLTKDQYLTAISLRRQFRASLQALCRGDLRKFRRFYSLCAELSHKKNQYTRLGNESGNDEIIRNIKTEIRQLSAHVLS